MGLRTPELRPAAEQAPLSYSRRSSGLVREMSLGSNVAMTLLFMSPPLAVLSATTLPSVLPGANPFWAHVITAVAVVFPTLLFAYFVRLMPRAGGDYVFVSRTLHPVVGFVANFSLVVWFLLAAALLGNLAAPFALSPAFATIGAVAESAWFTTAAADVASRDWGFALGAITMVLAAVSVSLPLRHTLRIVKLVFGFVAIGLVVTIAVLLFSSRDDFRAAVTEFGGDYDGVIAAATAAGYPGGTPIDWGNTLLGLPVAFVAYGYAFLGVYAGSELRSPRTSGRLAMFTALGVMAVIGAGLMALAWRTFGIDFLGAATALSDAGSEEYPFAAPSFFFFFVSMLLDSAPLVAVVMASFAVAWMAVAVPSFMIASRSLFAWAFDRIVPTRLSEVHPRTGTPVVGNMVLLAVTLAFLAIAVYAEEQFLDLFFGASMAVIITLIVVGIAGTVFPFRQRGMWEASGDRRVAGVPLMSLVGVAATAVWIYMFAVFAFEDALGANISVVWWGIVVIFVAALAIYSGSYLLNRRRGVDISLAFRELPPE
jgi:amino acid transporter